MDLWASQEQEGHLLNISARCFEGLKSSVPATSGHTQWCHPRDKPRSRGEDPFSEGDTHKTRIYNNATLRDA